VPMGVVAAILPTNQSDFDRDLQDPDFIEGPATRVVISPPPARQSLLVRDGGRYAGRPALKAGSAGRAHPMH